jgi:hypothetical protein
LNLRRKELRYKVCVEVEARSAAAEIEALMRRTAEDIIRVFQAPLVPNA